jgi:hypothetical protein
MTDEYGMVFDEVRHCKRIGEHPSHKELRARNEARLALMKQNNKLVYRKEEHESTTTRSRGNAYTDTRNVGVGGFPSAALDGSVDFLTKSHGYLSYSSQADLVDSGRSVYGEWGQDSGVRERGYGENGSLRDATDADGVHIERERAVVAEPAKPD